MGRDKGGIDLYNVVDVRLAEIKQRAVCSIIWRVQC